METSNKPMTTEDCREKVEYLINESAHAMKANIAKLLDSNVINLNEWENNFILPKIMLCALLQDEQFEYKPLDRNKEHLKLIKQLYLTL